MKKITYRKIRAELRSRFEPSSELLPRLRGLIEPKQSGRPAWFERRTLLTAVCAAAIAICCIFPARLQSGRQTIDPANFSHAAQEIAGNPVFKPLLDALSNEKEEL